MSPGQRPTPPRREEPPEPPSLKEYAGLGAIDKGNRRRLSAALALRRVVRAGVGHALQVSGALRRAKRRGRVARLDGALTRQKRIVRLFTPRRFGACPLRVAVRRAVGDLLRSFAAILLLANALARSGLTPPKRARHQKKTDRKEPTFSPHHAQMVPQSGSGGDRSCPAAHPPIGAFLGQEGARRIGCKRP